MAKLNSTFDSGFFIPDDFNLKSHEADEKRRRQEKRERDDARRASKKIGPRKEGEDTPAAAAGDTRHSKTTRQTWMVDYEVVCDGCESNIAKGTKVYANVAKLKERYLREVPIYELTIRCPFCSVNKITFVTDPERATYKVLSGGRRAGGGAMDWAKPEKEAAEGNEPEVPEELAKRLERRKNTILDAEAVDAGVDEELRKIFFPPADILVSLRRRLEQEALQRQAAIEESHRVLLDQDERTAILSEFDRLRKEYLAQHGGGAHSTANDDDIEGTGVRVDAAPTAGVRVSDGIMQKHDSMIARVVAAGKEEAPPAASVDETRRETPPPVANTKGSLLRSLVDYS